MRCLVISDLHGNIRALEAVLATAGTVDLVIALGDYLGFGLHPNDVVNRVRTLPNLASIKGNWSALAQRRKRSSSPSTSDSRRKESIGEMVVRMGIARLTAETKAFLKSLPVKGRLNLEGVPIVMVHGSVLQPLKGYLEPNLDPALLKKNVEASQAHLVLHGDTHIQGAFEVEGVTFVNPGSVGWPSDGDWRAAYALITFEEGRFQVEFGRAEYDVESVYREMDEAGLPNARNILSGRSIWDVI